MGKYIYLKLYEENIQNTKWIDNGLDTTTAAYVTEKKMWFMKGNNQIEFECILVMPGRVYKNKTWVGECT